MQYTPFLRYKGRLGGVELSVHGASRSLPPLAPPYPSAPLRTGKGGEKGRREIVNELLNIYNPRLDRGSSVFDFVAAPSHGAFLPLPLGEGRGGYKPGTLFTF